MKKNKFYSAALLLVITAAALLPACKKGSDDPVISLISRKDRFTNTWTLTKYEKNGVSQSLSGTTYLYNVYSTGTLKRTVEGAIFGFPVTTVNDGTWVFLNDDEDVRIIISGEDVIYNIQRLASKELWLKRVVGADTYFYYFDGV